MYEKPREREEPTICVDCECDIATFSIHIIGLCLDCGFCFCNFCLTRHDCPGPSPIGNEGDIALTLDRMIEASQRNDTKAAYTGMLQAAQDMTGLIQGYLEEEERDIHEPYKSY